MTSLSERFHHDRPALLARIQEAPTRDAVGLLHDYVSGLTDQNGDYAASLTRDQARVALSVLGFYRDHLKNLMDVFARLEAYVESRRSPDSSIATGSHQARLPDADTLAGIGVAGLIGAFLTNPLIAIPLALGGGLIASQLVRFIDLDQPPSSEPGVARESLKLVAPGDGNSLANLFTAQLGELFETVDTLVAEHGRLEDAARPKPSERKLEDHPRVLAFLQDLIGWFERQKGELSGGSAETLRFRIEEQLPGLLSEYGIQVRHYDPRSGERDLSLFDFEEEVGALKLSGPVMDQPALLKKGEVLSRGRVLEPRQSSDSK